MDNEYIILSDINKRQVLFRRIVLFGLVLISVIFATIKWALFIPSDLNQFLRYGLIFLFCATFGWISLYFWSSIFGFFELLRRKKMPGIKRAPAHKRLTTKTAILMPVYNENPLNVYANLLAMARDLEKTGQETAFDFFVLFHNAVGCVINVFADFVFTEINCPEAISGEEVDGVLEGEQRIRSKGSCKEDHREEDHRKENR